MDKFQILHLSDLHISNRDDFDRSILLDSLIECLEVDKRNGNNPEIVVLSGDISMSGRKDEYDKTEHFLSNLRKVTQLKNSSIFMVPGNHDVNRSLYRPSDIPSFNTMKELNDELENVNYRNDLLKGLNNYYDFIECNYPHLQSKNSRLVPFISSLDTNSGKKIGLVGLNSAWMCRRSNDLGKIAIGEYQVNKAFDELKSKGDYDLVITIFHHPLSWLWPVDRKICRKYFRNTIILNGHLHDIEGGFYHDLQGELFQFQAGASYIGSESELPNKFSYISINWGNRTILLDSKRFSSKYRKWIIDTDFSDDGKTVFPLYSFIKKDIETDDIKKEENKYIGYKRATYYTHRYTQTQGFETQSRLPIEIDNIFTPFSVSTALYGKELGKQFRERDRSATFNVQNIFEYIRETNTKDIILLGDPGSGKTTFLKQLVCDISRGKVEKYPGIPRNLIPIYAPLREIIDNENETFVTYLKRVSGLNEHAVSEFSLTKMLEEGRIIILLDGLDEITNYDKRVKTCHWINEARVRLPKVIFIITSRYIGYTGSDRLFNDELLELYINPFDANNVNEFISKWFLSAESIIHQTDDDEAVALAKRHETNLIESINRSSQLVELSKNPLMLQLIILVFMYKGALPQRRADLFDECINVLLERWDMAKGLQIVLPRNQARFLLRTFAFWIHKNEGDKAASFADIDQLFDPILEEFGKKNISTQEVITDLMNRSSILTEYMPNEIGFSHISFQEFLAAEEIVRCDNIDFLADKFGDSWWKEVTFLALSIHPSKIIDFIKKIIDKPSFIENEKLIIELIEGSDIKPHKSLVNIAYDSSASNELRNAVIRILRKTGGLDSILSLLHEEDKEKSKKIKDEILNEIVTPSRPSEDVIKIQSQAQIFISYAREDKDIVADLYDKLVSNGFRPWMDIKNILPGELWKKTLIRAIQSSDFFLACMSKNSVKKRGIIQKELKHALDVWDTKLDSDIYLIPVRLQACEVPESLSSFQWVNLYEKSGLALLMNSLLKGMERKAK